MVDEVRCVVEIRSELGEGPVWSEAEQALYWLDCMKPAVYRYDPASGENRSLDLPLDSAIGTIALPWDAGRSDDQGHNQRNGCKGDDCRSRYTEPVTAHKLAGAISERRWNGQNRLIEGIA